MAINDDVIDRAIDAAEASMEAAAEESNLETTENEQPKDSDPQEDIAVQEAITKEQEPKETKEAPKRDKGGKFTKAAADKTDLSDQQANAEQVEAVNEINQQAQAEVEPPIELPAFWSAEEKAALAKAPRDLQKIIADKEAQRSDWANRIANEAERGKAFLNKLNSDFESADAVQRHRAELALNGIKDEVEELHRYRAWDRLFKTDVRSAITDLMHKNGLSPYDLLEGADAQQQAVNDPRIDEALSSVQELQNQIKQQQEEAERQRLASEIESFKNGKDSLGQVRRPYAEMFSLGITQETDRILKMQPNKPLNEALNEAYERVLTQARQQFGINGKVVSAPKTQEQIVAETQKAKAAASSVVGAPSSGTARQRPKAKTIDEAIDRAEEALGLR